MTNHRSKLTTLSLSLSFAVALTILPFNALATSSTTTPPVAHGFCANLTQDESKVASGLSAAAAKMTQTRAEAAAKLQQARTSVDAKVVTNRAGWDATRLQHFAKLEAKATTPVTKLAVTTFEQTVLSAVATRRAAFDQARAMFRTGVDSTIANRYSQVDIAAATLKTTIASAESQAQASCDAGTLSATVRTTFVAAMKSARTNYQSTVASIAKIDPAVLVLAQTRKAADSAAAAAFTSTVHSAAATLKTALHQ